MHAESTPEPKRLGRERREALAKFLGNFPTNAHTGSPIAFARAGMEDVEHYERLPDSELLDEYLGLRHTAFVLGVFSIMDLQMLTIMKEVLRARGLEKKAKEMACARRGAALAVPKCAQLRKYDFRNLQNRCDSATSSHA